MLYQFFQKKAEDRLLREQRKYQDALRTMSQELIGFTNAEQVSDFVGNYVGTQMQLTSAQLLVHTNGLGFLPAGQRPDAFSETLQRWYSVPGRANAIIHAEIGESRQAPSDPELRAVRTWMRRANLSAIVPGCLRGDLLTCLLLGLKKTGEMFTQEDYDVLGALTRQSALVVKNLQLYEEVAKQQRLAEIGELMAAINHESNNVLAIISGTMQMIAEKLKDPELKAQVEGLQEEVQRGQFPIRAATAYRQKYLTPLQPWSLAKLVEAALSQAEQDQFAASKPQFTITTSMQPDGTVVGCATIPELLANCLRCLGWSCDSQPGQLTIDVTMANGMVYLKFAAQGGEDLRAEIEKEGERAQPGRHGKLYYILAKMIVADHKGMLAVESTPGGGTTLIVRLPKEQPLSSPPPPTLAAAGA